MAGLDRSARTDVWRLVRSWDGQLHTPAAPFTPVLKNGQRSSSRAGIMRTSTRRYPDLAAVIWNDFDTLFSSIL